MRNSKPIIGITSTVVNHNQIRSINLHEKFIRAVIDGGGVPIVIPIGTVELAEEWVSVCDGIILSNGEDIDPHSYGAAPDPKIQKTYGRRDQLEIEIVRQALKHNRPILGICRGITMLNVALGGTVIQDIEKFNPTAMNHYQQAERSEPTHEVSISESSRLYKMINTKNIRVNSMHHQSIDQLSTDLTQVAMSADGVIEAVEGVRKHPLLLGIQWHPEEMATEDVRMQQIFTDFIAECRVANSDFITGSDGSE
ncbi:gamma-glutamyl-gamma-aminobutyrate hydrolase family protein [Halalkalibacter alkaliphilus]|uniref:Gamma-glutamyl-gamma-aminobutyrate hydrolase family protein n=1 Tax=Halalkalibacter alkaliphilus TaxID=2917993 RepID=A0A9X2I9G2_9BACI|nr:gamma-glutamyl-gamma-aminobutyrate hydrolase family protein [Halalkalibacter alkaliphilus]MCL7748735.1 gamma-glutamyl-gamma-aminobutyrate hydrolase family protein [Halalkalibacter alkaliphilus]